MVTIAERIAESNPEAVAEKPKAKWARKPKAKVQAVEKPKVDGGDGWAQFGVAFTLVLSAALNGYANAQHAYAQEAAGVIQGGAWAAWLLGVAVPVLVLVLSRVAGRRWKKGQIRRAWLAGGSGIGILFLSVWHCACSIAMLTGGGLFLAVPMAVAIDCGLVACELALIGDAAG